MAAVSVARKAIQWKWENDSQAFGKLGALEAITATFLLGQLQKAAISGESATYLPFFIICRSSELYLIAAAARAGEENQTSRHAMKKASIGYTVQKFQKILIGFWPIH